jgi:hypothetical protein
MGSSSSVPETTTGSGAPRDASLDIGHIRMFRSRQTGQFIPLRPDDPEFGDVFWAAAAAVSLALDLLSSEQGVFALVETTRRIQQGEVPAHVRAIKDGQIVPTIRHFLSLIRGNFPHILLTRLYGMHNKNGRTNKRDCFGVFKPQQAAVIEISSEVRINLLGSDFSFSFSFFNFFL